MRRDQRFGVGAFLAGAGLGTLITLLIAPWSGEETRELLAAKVRQGKNYAAQKTGEIADHVGDSLKTVKTGLQDAVEAGKDAYREQIRRI